MTHGVNKVTVGFKNEIKKHFDTHSVNKVIVGFKKKKKKISSLDCTVLHSRLETFYIFILLLMCSYKTTAPNSQVKENIIVSVNPKMEWVV